MHNRWFRVGNFFASESHYVEFKNSGGTMRRITFTASVSGYMSITLDVSPCHINEYESKCNEIIERTIKSTKVSLIELTKRGEIISISIFNAKDVFLRLLLDLFNYFNGKYKPIEFTDDVILELRQINSMLAFIDTPQWHKLKHFLPEEAIVKVHINPAKKNSHQLNDLISTKFSYKKFRAALVAGENPNQRKGNWINETASYKLVRDIRSIYRMNSEISLIELYNSLELLYFYGANIFDRNNGGEVYESDFEMAYRDKDPIILGFVTKILSTLERPLTKTKDAAKLVVKSISYFRKEKETTETKFHFSNNVTVVSDFIHSDQLLEKKVECRKLFDRFFRDPNNVHENVNTVFEENFSPHPRRFVELLNLESENKLSGVNLKETYLSKVVPNCIVIHGPYTFLNPELRPYQLSSLLAFCFPHIIKYLYPHYEVAYIYSPTNYPAYSMMHIAKTLLHCPKHQSPKIQLLVNEFAETVYDHDVTIIHNEMTWGVREKFPLVSRMPTSKKEPDFLEDCYHKFIASGNYPFVVWLISKESLEEQKNIAKELGFDLLTFIEQQAKKLRKPLEKVLKIPSTRLNGRYSFAQFFQPESKLFWDEEKAPVIRSKL